MGVLEETDHNHDLHKAPVAMITCGKKNAANVTKYIMEINQQVYKNENEDLNEQEQPLDRLQVLGRNIMIHPITTSKEHNIQLIKHQSDYFTSLSYTFVPNLPPPEEIITTTDNQEITLRQLLLNICNNNIS